MTVYKKPLSNHSIRSGQTNIRNKLPIYIQLYRAQVKLHEQRVQTVKTTDEQK